MKAEIHKELEVWQFDTAQSFYEWLSKSLSRTDSVWLRLAKKNSPVKTLNYEEAREQAIIWGWIDGLTNRWDENFYLVKFTPRRKRSKWSKINRDIAEQLITEERMMPSGLAQVEAAKNDGRWEAAYDSPSTVKTPQDFALLLDANPTTRNLNADDGRSQKLVAERLSTISGLCSAM